MFDETHGKKDKMYFLFQHYFTVFFSYFDRLDDHQHNVNIIMVTSISRAPDLQDL